MRHIAIQRTTIEYCTSKLKAFELNPRYLSTTSTFSGAHTTEKNVDCHFRNTIEE